MWNVCSIYNVLFLTTYNDYIRLEIYIYSKSSDPLSIFGKFTTGPSSPDIPSHLLGYSNKDRNPSAGIELKICFLLYYKIKTYKVPNYLLFCKHYYAGVFSYISITRYLWPVKYLEGVISIAFTMNTGTCVKWESSLEDYFSGIDVAFVLSFRSALSNFKITKIIKNK